MYPPIIAFSKDWHEDPTSNHHVLRELAKTRRVLWLNSVATRRPTISSNRDLGRIVRKLREFRRGPVNVENDAGRDPARRAAANSAAVRALNREILRWTIRDLRARLGIDAFHLWTFLPNTAPYVGSLGEELAVYYCVDEWGTYPGLDRAEIARIERQLLERVDVTFATSHALVEAKRLICRATYFAPHGVDHARFARALDDNLASFRPRGRARTADRVLRDPARVDRLRADRGDRPGAAGSRRSR